MSIFDPARNLIGPVRALGESKKYAIAAVVIGGSVSISIAAEAAGDRAMAISALWPASIVAAAYVLGQGLVDAASAWRGPPADGPPSPPPK